MIFINKKR